MIPADGQGRTGAGRIAGLAALAMSLAAAAGACWTSERIYERLPHNEDEFAYLWEAHVMSDGKIWLPSPDPPRSFLVPFVVDHEGRRFGKYPPGWPAALSLAIRAGDPWLLNPVLAGASVWLIYRLATRVAGGGAGILSAALAAGSPFVQVLAGTLMSHVFGLFLALTFTVSWLDLFPARGPRAKRPPGWILVLVAGLSLGLLALTRPLTAVGVALPFAAHGLWRARRGAGSDRRRVIGVATAALALAAMLPFWQAALTGDPWRNPYTLWWEYDRIGFGPGIGRMASGHTLALAWDNAQVSLTSGQHDLFGWPHLSWVFLPFGLIALRRSRDAWLVAGVIPALIAAYAFYWIGTWLYGPRYYFEALPGAVILTSAGIVWLAGEGERAGRLRRYAVATLVLVLAGANGAFYLPPRLSVMQGLYGMSGRVRDVFVTNVPPRALVIVHLLESWTEYGNLVTLQPPFCECDRALAYSRGAAQDDRAAAQHPQLTVYHYFADKPGIFRLRPERQTAEPSESG